MHLLSTMIALACLAGCAAMEHSAVPEPTGEWVPVNPPRLAGETAPGARPTSLSAVGKGVGR
jgi:hypothetical protein